LDTIEFGGVAFWLALVQIIWVSLLLSGDNAVVIALVARSLPPWQRVRAILVGSIAAIVMRAVFALAVAQLLQLPYLKLIGAMLLVYIGVTLVLPEAGPAHSETDDDSWGFAAAMRALVVAAVLLSFDNMVAVAAAAKGSTLLLIIGLALSIPMVVLGSTLVLKVIERFPLIVWLGAALLGFIAGEVCVSDSGLQTWAADLAISSATDVHTLGNAAGALGAVIVLIIGRALLNRQSGGTPQALAGLANRFRPLG